MVYFGSAIKLFTNELYRIYMENANLSDVRRDAFSITKVRIFELIVFALFVFPSVFLAYFSKEMAEEGFIFTAATVISQNMALLALILFFLWRNREPFSVLGWRSHGIMKEISIGIMLFIPFSLLATLAEKLFLSMGLQPSTETLPAFLSAQGPYQMVLAGLLVVVVAVSEETIYRGYLILRFFGITKNMTAAVLISSFLFSFGHGYEGSAGVATVSMMGLFLALIYVWRRNLIPAVVIHFLQDFIGIIVTPLLTN